MVLILSCIALFIQGTCSFELCCTIVDTVSFFVSIIVSFKVKPLIKVKEVNEIVDCNAIILHIGRVLSARGSPLIVSSTSN